MNQCVQKICALYGCDNPVRNWRMSCCCMSHQKKYAAKKRHNTENKPSQTKEELIIYHRRWALDKQKRAREATPIWADTEKIKQIYLKSIQLSETTGIKHEVDHIIPLTNKLVCGLHVENNLQILTFAENRKKRNRFSIE